MRALHILAVMLLLILPTSSWASPDEGYAKGIALATKGDDTKAIAYLRGAGGMLEPSHIWRQRMESAALLLQVREDQATRPAQLLPDPYQGLVERYLSQKQAPDPASSVLVGVIGTVIPGAGHVWLGRYRDAAVAAIMVWPLIIITLWAAYLRMGPFTMFISIVTVWLWSGSVFSAVSLAQRGTLDAYHQWWQQMWMFSALPGVPW